MHGPLPPEESVRDVVPMERIEAGGRLVGHPAPSLPPPLRPSGNHLLPPVAADPPIAAGRADDALSAQGNYRGGAGGERKPPEEPLVGILRSEIQDLKVWMQEHLVLKDSVHTHDLFPQQRQQLHPPQPYVHHWPSSDTCSNISSPPASRRQGTLGSYGMGVAVGSNDRKSTEKGSRQSEEEGESANNDNRHPSFHAPSPEQLFAGMKRWITKPHHRADRMTQQDSSEALADILRVSDVTCSQDQESHRRLSKNAVARMEKQWDNRMSRHLSRLRRERKEPINDKHFMVKFVRSRGFLLSVACAIIANAVFIGLEVDYSMREVLKNPNFEKPQTFVAANITFTIFFAMELLISLFALRLHFFTGRGWQWNIFDLMLVVLSLLDLGARQESGSNAGYIRLLRGFRMARVLRIVRILRLFRELRRMCMSVISCLVSLCWALLLLFLIVYVFAVLFMQAGVNELSEADGDPKMWSRWYGDLGIAVYSLTKAIAGGEDWGPMVDPLQDISVLYVLAFCFFVLFVVFGVLNVLTGVFLERAVEMQTHDRDWLTQAEMIKMEKFVDNLSMLFYEMDLDDSGILNWAEFLQAMENPSTQAFFTSHELDISDAHLVFSLMVRHDGTVDIMDFIKGCSRSKGYAKSAHLMALMRETEMLHADVAKVLRVLESFVLKPIARSL